MEAGDTWRLCSIEDKLLVERQEEAEGEGKKSSVTARTGNNVKPGDKQFGAAGGNKTESKPNPSRNGAEKEMAIEDNPVASLVKEVPTSGRAMTASKSGKDPTVTEPMVYVEQPRFESAIWRTDVNKSEENDHAEDPILANSNTEMETEKAATETKETTPMKGLKTQPTVNTPKNISETSVQATKVKESKAKPESVLNNNETNTKNGISTIFQNNETTTSHPTFSDPETKSNVLGRLTAQESTANNNAGMIKSNQIVRESNPTEAKIGSTEKGESVSTEATTTGSTNVMKTTRMNPVERVSVQRPANSSQEVTTSNTPRSRLKPNVESTTSTYSITSSPRSEEKQLYSVVDSSAKSTQSSVSTDLAKLASAVDQKEGIASKDNIAISGSEAKWKGGEDTRMPGEAIVDQSENGSSPKQDFPPPQLNITNQPVFDQSVGQGSNEIEMTEVLLEEPIDSTELKQVMKAVLQESKETEKESFRQKRAAEPGYWRVGRARRGRKGGATARRFVAGKSGREQPEYCLHAFLSNST